jgi:hypothetical protein
MNCGASLESSPLAGHPRRVPNDIRGTRTGNSELGARKTGLPSHQHLHRTDRSGRRLHVTVFGVFFRGIIALCECKESNSSFDGKVKAKPPPSIGKDSALFHATTSAGPQLRSVPKVEDFAPTQREPATKIEPLREAPTIQTSRQPNRPHGRNPAHSRTRVMISAPAADRVSCSAARDRGVFYRGIFRSLRGGMRNGEDPAK